MNNKNLPFAVCIFIWVAITLIRLALHQPWYDEAWAWELARNFQFGSILESLSYEGHFFVWYFLLLPFAKLNLFYPYSMQLLNWFFCFGAIYILWKYFPFNNFVKTFITFSFPFLTVYPILARCYSVGIFLLFVLTAMYKDRLKYPVIYSILIFICANTSLMALIGSILFGYFLIYDLFNAKQFKDLKICLCVALLSIVSFIIQTAKVSTDGIPIAKMNGLNLDNVLTTFPLFPSFINAFLFIFFILGFCFIFFKNKRVFGFLAIIYGFLLYFFKNWYLGDYWHNYFFFVYLICACWIFADNNLNINLKKWLTILLCAISFLFIFDFRIETRFFNSKSKEVADYVKEHKNIHSIFMNSVFLMSMPYLHDDTYDIVLIHSSNRNHDIIFDFDSITNVMEKNKENYLYVNTCAPVPNLQKENKILKFELKKNMKNIYCIYRISVIENSKS